MILLFVAFRDNGLVAADAIMRNAYGARSLMALASYQRLSQLPIALADLNSQNPPETRQPTDSIEFYIVTQDQFFYQVSHKG
jgi:hypothetical protein